MPPKRVENGMVPLHKYFSYMVKYRFFLKIYIPKSITVGGSISIKTGFQEYIQTDELDSTKSLN